MFKYYLLFIVFSAVSCSFTRIIELGQGKVRGLRSISGQDRYYGIPYATSRRFERPKSAPSWKGVLTATDRFGSCAQAISILTLGTEDCLQLDVYAPHPSKPGRKLPVLMFIHGGAYYYGSKAHYDPEFLVTKNTIVVIINYRVGVLGFLCVGQVANLGLFDQVAALRWIQKNISAFGGDPDNVTIGGQSAGASAAAMHLLSPHSTGLFHKAILMSGSPLAPWAFNIDNLTPALEDAAKLQPVNATTDILKIFSEANLRDLLLVTRDTSINTKYFKYSPCVEENTTNPFFPGKPYDVLKSGQFNKVPIIIGYASVEGMLFYGLHNKRTLEEFDKNFYNKLPSVFEKCNEEHKRNISDIFRQFYFGSGLTMGAVVDYYSDWIAYSSINEFSDLMSVVSDKPVYNYIFSYEGDRNFAKMIFGSSRQRGASHSDDIFYVFKPAGLSLVLTTPDQIFIDRLTSMLANFMRTGNPTPKRSKLLPTKWLPFSQDGVLLNLGRKMTLTVVPKTHRAEIWKRLLCKYGAKGYVPCDGEGLCEKMT